MFLISNLLPTCSAFINLLVALQHRLGLPFKLFQMSGPSFSDDKRFITFLKQENIRSLQLEVVPPFTKGEDLIGLASQAYGTLSMSFHGCILSMIGDCPAIPINLGKYYDYKYADFARYVPRQDVPIVYLNDLNNLEELADRICSYFLKYQPTATAIAREKADNKIKQWYYSIK